MSDQMPDNKWQRVLADQIDLLGHRNWIVVADSAYPKQVAAGVKTIATGADHFLVLEAVIDAVATAHHVRPIVYLDSELPFLDEEYAPGIETTREKLGQALAGLEVHSDPHEEIIGKLDEAGSSFQILLLKTNLALPYTSVFLQLDCGYWSEKAEQVLRRSIEHAG